MFVAVYNLHEFRPGNDLGKQGVTVVTAVIVKTLFFLLQTYSTLLLCTLKGRARTKRKLTLPRTLL